MMWRDILRWEIHGKWGKMLALKMNKECHSNSSAESHDLWLWVYMTRHVQTRGKYHYRLAFTQLARNNFLLNMTLCLRLNSCHINTGRCKLGKEVGSWLFAQSSFKRLFIFILSGHTVTLWVISFSTKISCDAVAVSALSPHWLEMFQHGTDDTTINSISCQLWSGQGHPCCLNKALSCGWVTPGRASLSPHC